MAGYMPSFVYELSKVGMKNTIIIREKYVDSMRQLWYQMLSFALCEEKHPLL